MSEESAEAFLEKLRNDEEFSKSLDEELCTSELDLDEIFFAAAKGAGFNFTKHEMISALPDNKFDVPSEDDVKDAASRVKAPVGFVFIKTGSLPETRSIMMIWCVKGMPDRLCILFSLSKD